MTKATITITAGIWNNGVDKPYQITAEMLRDEVKDILELCKEKLIFNGCHIKYTVKD